MPTILAAATPPSLGKSWHDIATAAAQEPPFLPGDGMDLWPYLSGAVESSSRTEILHEAHAQGSTDGNGNALRVGDWKIVMRTGGQWNHLDGWYGGPESSDKRSGACKCSRSLRVVRRPHSLFFDTYTSQTASRSETRTRTGSSSARRRHRTSRKGSHASRRLGPRPMPRSTPASSTSRTIRASSETSPAASPRGSRSCLQDSPTSARRPS